MNDKKIINLSEEIEKRSKTSMDDDLPIPIALIPMQSNLMWLLEMSYFVGIIAMFSALLIALIYTVIY